MPKQEELNWLVREIDYIVNDRNLPESKAFESWCLMFSHEITLDDSLVYTDTVSIGDRGIDGWYHSQQDSDFFLWQCKWDESRDLQHKYGVTPVQEVITGFEALLNSDALSEKLLEISIRLKESILHGDNIILCAAIPTVFNSTVDTRFAELSAQANNMLLQYCSRNGIDYGLENDGLQVSGVRIELYDIDKFYGYHEDRHPSNQTLSGVSVKLKMQSSSFLDIGDILPNGWKAVIVTLNGKSIGEIAAIHKEKLCSLNVRFALNPTKRIREIHNTIVDHDMSMYFWLYNNGITILCDGYECENDQIEIINPQVVNGCQTVSSFRNKRKYVDDKSCVLARIIIPPGDDEGEEQAALIAKNTNNQSPVKTQDLRSNDPVQMKIHVKFDSLELPWFYERKRGEWKTIKDNRGMDRYRNDNGSYRKFTNEEVAQSYWSIDDPVSAIRNKGKIWDDDETYKKIFDARRSAEVYLLPCILMQFFNDFWSASEDSGVRVIAGNLSDDEIIDENKIQRLMRAKGLLCSHSVALTVRVLTQEGRLTAELAKKGIGIFLDHPEDFITNNKSGGFLYQLCLDVDALIDNVDAAEDGQTIKNFLEKKQSGALEFLWKSMVKAGRSKHQAKWKEELQKELLSILDHG